MTKQMKKIMPAKSETRGTKVMWSKRGGYAGEKTIRATIAKAKAAGFTEFDAKQYGCPDGSTVGSGTYYRAPSGDVLYVSSSYGVTAPENHYSITYTPATQG